MAGNQTGCLRLEQRSVMKFLVAEKCKPCEIYRSMSCVYVENGLVKTMLINVLYIYLPL